jgi:hypothetical protein
VDFSNRGDKNNFGPRAGLAWDLKNDGKTVVPRGLRALLQPDEHAVGAVGDSELSAAELR